MLAFALRRVLEMVPILFGICLITFAIVHMAPGGPFDLAENPRVPQEAKQRIIRLYGLDQPLPVQFARWMRGVLTLNFGWSFDSGRPVGQILAERLPATLLLMGAYLFVSLLVAVPLGVVAAVRRHSLWDYGTSVFAYAGVSTPAFWLGIMLMFLFAVKLRLFPTHGMSSYGRSDPLDVLWHLALPVATLSMLSIAEWSRYVRAQMLEVIRQDYVRTARAKGLSERVVLYKHALKNALLPVVTLLGLSAPQLVSGAAITETIFAWPGLGRVSLTATQNRDYPLVMAFIVLSGVAVMAGNLLADLAYAWFDPRIRYE